MQWSIILNSGANKKKKTNRHLCCDPHNHRASKLTLTLSWVGEAPLSFLRHQDENHWPTKSPHTTDPTPPPPPGRTHCCTFLLCTIAHFVPSLNQHQVPCRGYSMWTKCIKSNLMMFQNIFEDVIYQKIVPSKHTCGNSLIPYGPPSFPPIPNLLCRRSSAQHLVFVR